MQLICNLVLWNQRALGERKAGRQTERRSQLFSESGSFGFRIKMNLRMHKNLQKIYISSGNFCSRLNLLVPHLLICKTTKDSWKYNIFTVIFCDFDPQSKPKQIPCLHQNENTHRCNQLTYSQSSHNVVDSKSLSRLLNRNPLLA